MIQVQVRLFGAFRNFSPESPFIALNLNQHEAADAITVSQIKDALSHHLGPDAHALIQDSVLATEDRVLLPEDQMSASSKLAILPPVCGG